MMFSGRSPKDVENAQLKRKIEEMDEEAAQQKEAQHQLELQLEAEAEQKNACIQSNQMYEKRMQELEERMEFSRKKEAERRSAA